MNLGDELDKAFPTHTLPPSAFDDADLRETLGRMRCQFWACPVDGHSWGTWAGRELVQTVKWRGDLAYCLAPGCGRTSADPAEERSDLRCVVDDGCRWWLCFGDSLGGHMFPARTARNAVAAFRRELFIAERNSGRTVNFTRSWLAAAGLRATGPFTTIQAYEYDLAMAYGVQITRWSRDEIQVTTEPGAVPPLAGIDLAEKLPRSEAAQIRREVRERYLPVED
jgi:hypothetical protein